MHNITRIHSILHIFYHNILPFLSLIFLLLWFSLSYSFNILPPIGTYIAILTFLAVLMTIWPPNNPLNKSVWLIVFFCLMFFEINNLYKIQNKYDTDRANLLQEQRDSFKNIIKQVNDSRNNEQINASNLLTRQENLFGTITGGDSFCYLIMHFLQPDTWTPFLITKGQHPLYDVSMSIVDLEKFNLIKNKPNLTFEELFSNYTTINIGNLVPAFAFPLWNQKIKLSPGPMHAYAINFFGRNGIWSQKIIIKKNSSGLWIQAIQVLRKDGDKNKVLFEMIPKEFQTDKNGKINWTEY